MWPFICQFIEKLFRETIEPAVRGAHTHLSTFSFTRVDLGQQVCLLLGFLTCAPLERTLSHFTLLSRASCFLEGWLCVQVLPGSPVSGSLLCRDLASFVRGGASVSPGPPAGPSAARSPITVTFVLSCRRGDFWGNSLMVDTIWKEPPLPPPCFKTATRGSSAGLAAPL